MDAGWRHFEPPRRKRRLKDETAMRTVISAKNWPGNFGIRGPFRIPRFLNCTIYVETAFHGGPRKLTEADGDKIGQNSTEN